jgi:hypothetical protein
MLAFLLFAALFVSEHRGQEYTLEHGDPVLFWVTDQKPPRYGTCFYMWGYVPVIICDGKIHTFANVEWCSGGL